MTAARDAVERAVAAAHRTEWAYVLAATVRVTHDLDAAEDCVQDVFLAALDAWARDGVPDRPGAWLTTVARRGALTAHARRATLQAKLPLLVEPAATGTEDPTMHAATDHDDIPDDRLRLVFTCCHPALAGEAQVALTLRLVCGVATRDIAAAFLVSEATMAARITRAKKKIAAAGIPFAVPGPAARPARLDAVLTTIHLLATTAHAHMTPADRALDLARMLSMLLPDEPEVAGLLALVLVHQARVATRTDAAGRLVRLEDQDRARWDRALIAEADGLVVAALTGPAAPGRFALQAAIAALHADAPTFAETDWPQILELYDALLAQWPSPVVALNRAVALAHTDGPDVALAAIAALEDDDRLAGYRHLPATKADLLTRAGRHDEAADAYRAALALTDSEPERAYLSERLG